MSDNKTKPTNVKVSDFLTTVSELRQQESRILIDIMQKISNQKPVMWGPSIIGFGTTHYKYDTGREGDMPHLGFSPRKASITVYFSEGFDRYSDKLAKLGKHKSSVSCLYINKLADVDIEILHQMIEQSYQDNLESLDKPNTVDEYIDRVPAVARLKFDELRAIVRSELPNAKEVFSYGIIGYKIDDKRARIFISGWKDHLAIYPVPKDENLQEALGSHIKGKGTLWFALDEPLPKALIIKIIRALIK